jgi:hypothetical protein
LAFIALCPADWVPRTWLVFELVVTSMVCLLGSGRSWSGGAFIVTAALLEELTKQRQFSCSAWVPRIKMHRAAKCWIRESKSRGQIFTQIEEKAKNGR